MKTYEKAPTEVAQRARKLVELYYPDIENAEVSTDFLMAMNDTGSAVTHGGYQALAQVRIISLKDRAAGRKDTEILIDKVAYNKMSPEQKDAMLDHELNHIIVMREDDNSFKTDDLDRPRVKLRKHDYQFGWFTSIAERHGVNSPEVFQAKMLWEENGQAFFPMLAGAVETQI